MELPSTELIEKLEQLLTAEPDFQRIEDALDVFCPFEAMGMVRAEIRHGNFLAYILDPNRPHRFGSGILRPFLMEAFRTGHTAGLTSGLTSLDAHLMDLDSVDVRREWQNIDLLIEIPRDKTVVAIELKIDASQSQGQLGRYRNCLEREWQGPDWRRVFVFLTKNEEKPNDHAWLSMRMSAVVSILGNYLREHGTGTLALQSVNAYKAMLDRHHMKDNELRKLAESIWSRHEEALSFLIKNRPDPPDPLGGILVAILAAGDEIAAKANEALKGQLTVIRDHDSSRILRFAVAKWDPIPGMVGVKWTASRRALLFELKVEAEAVFGYLYLGPGEGPERERIYKTLTASEPKKVSKGHIRIVLRSLVNAADELSLDDAVETIKDGFLDFVAREAPRIDKLLMPLLDEATNV